MKSTENMDKAKEVISDYLFWHKSVGLSGLSKGGNIASKTISAIRYRDEDTLSDADVKKLLRGLNYIRNKCNIQLDAMIANLESLEHGDIQ